MKRPLLSLAALGLLSGCYTNNLNQPRVYELKLDSKQREQFQPKEQKREKPKIKLRSPENQDDFYETAIC